MKNGEPKDKDEVTLNELVKISYNNRVRYTMKGLSLTRSEKVSSCTISKEMWDT